MAGHARIVVGAADRAGARRGLADGRARCRRGGAAGCWCCPRPPNRFFTSAIAAVAVAQRAVGVVGAARAARPAPASATCAAASGRACRASSRSRVADWSGAAPVEQVVVDLHHDPAAGLELDAVAVRVDRLVAARRPGAEPGGVVEVVELAGRPVPPKQVQPSPAVAASCASARRPGRVGRGRGSRGGRRSGLPGSTLLPVSQASCVEVRVEQEAAVVVGAGAVGRGRRVGLGHRAASSAARRRAAGCGLPGCRPAAAPRPRACSAGARRAGGRRRGARLVGRGGAAATARPERPAAPTTQDRPRQAQPGGQVIARPASRCRWVWKTLCPASGAGVEDEPVVVVAPRPRRCRAVVDQLGRGLGVAGGELGGVAEWCAAARRARGWAPAG